MHTSREVTKTSACISNHHKKNEQVHEIDMLLWTLLPDSANVLYATNYSQYCFRQEEEESWVAFVSTFSSLKHALQVDETRRRGSSSGGHGTPTSWIDSTAQHGSLGLIRLLKELLQLFSWNSYCQLYCWIDREGRESEIGMVEW